ncbi:hypothetical protein VNO77_34337 [Canavalia gladiata]|uniref:Uncharacterized protein n=1 Tax=Canavalia gladiata TaxID=3824 RepID=A0AAN9KEW1_CANGL
MDSSSPTKRFSHCRRKKKKLLLLQDLGASEASEEIHGLKRNAYHALYPGIVPHDSYHLKASNCSHQPPSYC